MADLALDGVLVVDLTSGVSGAYAGKLLADLGARVVMIEPEDGHPLRRRPPLRDGAAYGAMFAHLAGGKESVWPSDGGEAASLLGGLLAQADILLRDGASPWEGALPGLLPEPVVEVDLSPFGRSGPYAGWKGSDIASWAMGGYMYFTGEAEREPLMLPGSQSELHCGGHAAFAALAGLYERRRSGWGQRIEVTDLESALSAHAWLISSWAACGTMLERTTHDLIPCRDGWVYVMTMAPNPNIFLMIDKPELMTEEIGTDLVEWAAHVPRITELLREWALDYTALEIAERAQELRVAATPILDAEALSIDPQMAARAWWEAGDDVWDGAMRFPGQPYKLSVTPSARVGSAPQLGQHTAAVREAVAGASRPPAPAMPAQHDPPLRGIKVVEVTGNWAGPVAGRHLADLGAEVIKVEWAARPATRALFWPGPNQDLQRQPHNRAMYFNLLNRNKRDVVIDLATAEGQQVFKDLVREADVLIENNSARVMPNLGLDYAALASINPGLIMVSMAGFGATGPRKDWVAYGSNIETTSGLTAITGYGDGPLYRTTLFYADPVSGLHAVVAIMAALEHRRKTGAGQWVDISLNEAGAAFCCESLLEYQATGEVRRPAANRDARFAPQGAYRSAGSTDNWVAISVQTDAEWPALCEVIGRADLAADASLATLAGRTDRHDEIDAAITDWTQTWEQYEAAWALQRAGVSAAPVLANWQLLPDPHLHRRGFYIDVEHPVVGVYPYASWPWKFSRTPATITRAAPVFGEHSQEIFRELGYDAAKIAALYEAGVTADEPLAP